MNTYTLVITLLAGHYQMSNAIQIIPGYASRESCLASAQFYTDKIQPIASYTKVSAICLQKG